MIIYCATNLVNGKKYVGMTSCFKTRKRIHLNNFQDETNQKTFYCALRKYGLNNFTWKIIGKAKDRKQLGELEKQLIIEQKSHTSMHGYNETWGGDGGPGRPRGLKHTNETKAKIRAARANQVMTDEHMQKCSMLGRAQSDYQKQRVKEANSLLWRFISPEGEIHESFGGFKELAKSLDIPLKVARKWKNKGPIQHSKLMRKTHCVGWEILTLKNLSNHRT